jgi:hypothetical protein
LNFVFAVFFLLSSYLLAAQDTAGEGTITSAGVFPEGFRGIVLGMSLEEVKSRLVEDPYFDYRGDPDVSFLPQSQQSLIECRGFSFIDRAYFQFHEEELFIMILALNEERIDHYSLFTTLSEKYGRFSSLSPTKTVWDFGDLRMTLERPLSVKYIDMEVFSVLKAEGQVEEDLRSLSRSQFLELF